MIAGDCGEGELVTLVQILLRGVRMACGVPICAARALGCGLALLWVCLAGSSAAQVLDIPAECGSAEQLQHEISVLQHPRVQRARPAVTMYHDGAGYVLEVELPLGRRRLRDSDCRSLFRAAVLIAALGEDAYVEPPQVTKPSEPPLEPKEPAASEQHTARVASGASEGAQRPAAEALSRPPSAARGSAPAARPARSRPATRELAPFVLTALSHGLVPKVDALLAAGLTLRRGLLGGRAALAYLTPRSWHDGGEGVRITGVSATATLELVLKDWLRPGLGGDYHLLLGRGLGISRSRDDWAALATVHASLNLRVLRVGSFQLDLLARALYAPRSAQFRIRGRGEVYGTEHLGLQAGLALSYHLW